MKNKLVLAAFSFLFLTSCLIESPKYTSLDHVLSLKLGMSKAQVEDTLGVKPYNLKEHTDTGNIFIYVYRVTDRRTFSFFTKPVNGRKTLGKYEQLDVAYSNDDKVTRIESCRLCPDNLVNTQKINFEKITGFITITLPVLLIYFGLKK